MPDSFVAGMRMAYPGLCWRVFDDGKRCCILERGHDGGAHERPGPVTFEDVYVVRRIVARWLRIRGEHLMASAGLPGNMAPRGMQANLFYQLAADADHSDLLVRLLQGEEPLPFDEWLARGSRGG